MDKESGFDEAIQTPLPAEKKDKDVPNTTAVATSVEKGDSHHTTTTPNQSKVTDTPTVVLKTHDGDGYILPYLPWEKTKLQIEQIYKLRGHEQLAEAVNKGNFSVVTESGNIILPPFWDIVVKPPATVQVSLPSEILNPDIEWRDTRENIHRVRYQPPSPSVVQSPDSATKSVPEDFKSVLGDSDDNSSEIFEESDTEVASSGGELSESSVPIETTIEVSRPVIVPVDGDGNNISIQINTAFIGPLDQATTNVNNLPDKRESHQSLGDAEYLGIAKAVSTQTENRNTLQLHVLSGPRNPSMHPDISIRWYHLHSERLDFAKFKDTCLGISGLSERLHKLTRKLFEKVEEDKLKAFLDGMFIEPGMVLRADESHQSDPQSAIFSCIPYFDLQTPAKNTSIASHADRLFPPRTLMQSYYPYEPVRDRDEEQAYRKFGNERAGALIHVPNMWMVNIGSDIVVTCSHQALSKGFVQSIEVIQISRNPSSKEAGRPTNIRLTDWDGRKLLFSLEECRSYFQMEQKLKELRWRSNRSQSEKTLQLWWQTSNGSVKVTPGLWVRILRQRNALFVDFSLLIDPKKDGTDATIAGLPPSTLSSPDPFFYWPQTTDIDDVNTDSSIPAEIRRSIRCLEHVEKAMLSEVLGSYDTYGPVEKTFTSTEYYRDLPEVSADHTQSYIKSLVATEKKLPSSLRTGATAHQTFINNYCNAITEKTSEMYKTMHKTLALFVADVDKSTMLRKAWGAMMSICDIADATCKREPLSLGPDESTDSNWTHQNITHRGWFIRPDISDAEIPAALKKLKKTFERCRRCKENEMYNTSQAALLHLQKHLKQVNAPELSVVIPEDWIVNYEQMKLEAWDEGYVAILTKACQTAQELFDKTKELSDGVYDEHGQMPDFYTFPRALLSAFRQLLVFYFAVERAMHFTEDSFNNKRNAFEESGYMTTLPFSSNGLQVIETFGNGVKEAIRLARNELCAMAKSTVPVDVPKRISLSSEYVCAWFMRRLIVKPLEKSMTVSDMYREYLSTIQFQVNHRPGKRLLRSINLLQEELTALREVNTQQSNLILNYMSVLDDATYEKINPSRHAMFPYERMLLASCQDNLQLSDQEYRYLLARCGPLSDSTKQSLEINEEDHGKAIMVFTIVTIIFLPLSFVTSYLGMNTTDIRDMGSSSSLFWAIAIPLTAVTMVSILYIGYNGDELRDTLSSLYRTVTGKQDRSISARGISVAQRKRVRKSITDSNIPVDFSSLADEAEFANPQPDDFYHASYRHTSYHNRKGAALEEEEWDYPRGPRPPRRQATFEQPTMQWEPYASVANPIALESRMGLRQSAYVRPDVTIHRKTNLNDRRAQRRYSPPLRRFSPSSPLPTGHLFREPASRQEYDLVEELPVPGRVTRRSELLEQQRAPTQYVWMKKSHRHHRSAREDIRRRRNDKRDEWDENNPEEWNDDVRHRSRR